MCFSGLLREDICNISEVSYCDIYEQRVVAYNNLASAICRITKDTKEKRIKVFAHDFSYFGFYILKTLENMGFVDATMLPKKTGNVKVENRTYICTASDQKWYKIEIGYEDKVIAFIDSKNQAPVSIKEICEMFGIEYSEEKDYARVNLKAVSEIEKMLIANGMTKNTIGASCLDIFTKMLQNCNKNVSKLFPDLTKMDDVSGDYKSLYDYIYEAYHGGLCFVNPLYQDRVINAIGTSIDANSMYSSREHSKSGNAYPIGTPMYFKDARTLERMIENKNMYTFIRVRCDAFYLKDNKIPSVRATQREMFFGSQWLTEANTKKVRVLNGEMIKPEFIFTETDYKRFINDYYIKNIEIIDGYVFKAETGLFDEYIDKFFTMKKNATNKGERQIAKLANNNLSGKFAAKEEILNKAYNKNGESTIYYSKQKTVFIPIGAAITSYSRDYLLNTIYKIGYDNFLYCDTDSIHFLGRDTKDIWIDEKELGAWKVEHKWDMAIFYKQKMYIEREDGIYDFKCSGLSSETADDIACKLTEGDLRIEDIKGMDIYDKMLNADYNGYRINYIVKHIR